MEILLLKLTNFGVTTYNCMGNYLASSASYESVARGPLRDTGGHCTTSQFHNYTKDTHNKNNNKHDDGK